MTAIEKLIDILKNDMITIFENGFSDDDIEIEVDLLTEEEAENILDSYN